ncbi:hypothetical protein [Armatimonas sp.]|uniref:hypothetical protein n=1 Tax=Armatimonas sp. TaxID=1872638 RepID=UPI00286A93EB|nr:hypothetical protein [Armatimonas sp.]
MAKPIIVQFETDNQKAIKALTTVITRLGYTLKKVDQVNGLITFETDWQNMCVHIIDTGDVPLINTDDALRRKYEKQSSQTSQNSKNYDNKEHKPIKSKIMTIENVMVNNIDLEDALIPIKYDDSMPYIPARTISKTEILKPPIIATNKNVTTIHRNSVQLTISGTDKSRVPVFEVGRSAKIATEIFSNLPNFIGNGTVISKNNTYYSNIAVLLLAIIIVFGFIVFYISSL